MNKSDKQNSIYRRIAIESHIKEECEKYVHNAELGPYIEDKCNQHLNLTVSFTKEFKFHPRESRV